MEDAAKTEFSSLTLEGYLKKNTHQHKELETEVSKYETMIYKEREALFPLFKEFKSLQLLNEHALKERKRDEDAKAQKELDDQAQRKKYLTKASN